MKTISLFYAEASIYPSSGTQQCKDSRQKTTLLTVRY